MHSILAVVLPPAANQASLSSRSIFLLHRGLLSCILGFTAHALIPAGYFSIIGLINIFPAAKTYGCNM